MLRETFELASKIDYQIRQLGTLLSLIEMVCGSWVKDPRRHSDEEAKQLVRYLCDTGYHGILAACVKDGLAERKRRFDEIQ